MRRILALLLSLLLTATLVGCADDADGDLGAVDDIDGVAEVAQVPYADDATSTLLRVTLDDGLSEDRVRGTVEEIKEHFDGQDSVDVGSMQVVFDEFSAGVHPRSTSIENPDPDLERALWLREDGRATWFGPGPQFRPGTALSRAGTRPLALAPAADVAQLALDLEAEVSTDNEVRRSYLVGSPDGEMRVQWSNYPGGLDRDAVEALVALQRRLPGTTGWYDDSGPSAGVHFDDAEISLAAVLARGPRLVAGLPVTEVGWGPFHAQSFQELRRSTSDLRRVLPRLVALDGLRAITPYGDVEVDDLATFDAVRRLMPDETLALVREPNDLIGFEPEPVFEVSRYTRPDQLRLLRALADVDGVRSIGSNYLVLEREIADADLARVLMLVRPWVRGPEVDSVDRFELVVQMGEAPIYRIGEETPPLGTLTATGFTPADPLLESAREDDVDRIAAAWDDVVAQS